ncbi:MAG: YlxR family protein [Chloroflexi bacterium]|nr:YlxR family protein [Chloroflexota bacterium]
MTKKRKQKHIPQRTCIGCRKVQAKRSMVRVVRTAQGVQIDVTGKLAGRGAYLHQTRACWERGLKGALARALKTELTPDDFERLNAHLESIAEDDESTA